VLFVLLVYSCFCLWPLYSTLICLQYFYIIVILRTYFFVLLFNPLATFNYLHQDVSNTNYIYFLYLGEKYLSYTIQLLITHKIDVAFQILFVHLVLAKITILLEFPRYSHWYCYI